MNSKKKNKNRQNKTPNPTPPQKQEVCEPSDSPNVANLETESVVEERVPNIVSENVAPEVKEVEEFPKKPKRNRGKKKKEEDKGDKEDFVRVEETIVQSETLPINDSLDEANIAPTARKKKNKIKKAQDLFKDESAEEEKNENTAQLNVISSEPQDEPTMKKEESEQDMKNTKKKNKKKKHRNDSEKSEKAEGLSCTSAFQKLLTDETVVQPSTGDSSNSEATIKDDELKSHLNISCDVKCKDAVQKDDVNKNKKKNKKDKKQQATHDSQKKEDQTKSTETISPVRCDIPSNKPQVTGEAFTKETLEYPDVAESILSPSTSGDNNFKYKPTIIKPVDEKKENNENLGKHSTDTKNENIEDMKVFEIEPTQEAVTSETSPYDDSDNVILVPLTELTPDWHEEVINEEGNGPVIGCEDKMESTILEQPVRNNEKNKMRKKSPKTSKFTNVPKVASTLEEEALPKASTSSKGHVEMEPNVKHDKEVDLKLERKEENQDGKNKDISVLKVNEKKNREKTPDTSVCKELASVLANPSESLGVMSKIDEITTEATSTISKQESTSTEKNHDEMIEYKPETKALPLDETNLKSQGSDKGKKKSRKKSPMPGNVTNNNLKSVDVPQSDACQLAEPIQPAEPSCLDVVIPKLKDIIETQPNDKLEKTECKKDEIERITTPDGEKHQKRKRSPKPSVGLDLKSDSKSTKDSSQNILNIEDIIIIQAEVVSDEKAQKAETFVECDDSTDKKDNYKVEAKQFSGKSKKGKKSPKLPQPEVAHESKENSERDCILETQEKVQFSMTPLLQDGKLALETIAVELETPKIDPIPSPNDVTPDFIEYPRCSSEQHDKNNNMVIQEITSPDPHVEVPIIPNAPFIQSANISTSNIQSVESKNEERTDLKSKVMEVNQDMEELRMSIERSLAELTSLEKGDKNAEKKVEAQICASLAENKQPIPTQETELSEKPKPFSNQHVILPDESIKISVHPDSEVKSGDGPDCPAKKDPKGKGKSKKKAKQEPTQNTSIQPSTASTETSTQEKDKDATNKSEKSSDAQEKANKQTSGTKENKDDDLNINENIPHSNFQPIENFEDAMTSSVDDVNVTFEIIANEAENRLSTNQNNPEINVIAPQEDEKGSRQEKQNPVSPPKNLLGHPDIPVPSSKTDYKKEKNKPPNYRQAKVKIKDTNQVNIEKPEKSKESTESERKLLNFKKPDESICVTNQNDDYIYKYSFRKVFLQCSCHVCKQDLNKARVPCSYCNLIFYCNQRHKNEDNPQHQALCFAVSTIVHLKDQKFIYADSRNVTGHNYRLLRMQMIVSCEKVLKRKLVPWEQEALLYPRMCADPSCREWRQGKLTDCEGCGQISYCSEHPDHLPKSHSRWCKSYNLYRGLVKHQQTKGRLEPKLPTRVLNLSPLPDNINEVLAAMYEEKIEMNDIEYAALTQLATAPLTALFCLQYRPNNANGINRKSSLTLHIVGAELQFEADVLNKWEVFLLHLLPQVEELRIVMVGPDLNPSNLPLELLGKIKYCHHCQTNKRRVVFGFQDKRTYHEFWASEDFTTPDLVCAFNPSIQRSSAYNGKDTWPATINCIFKLKVPLAITSYTLSELNSDLLRVQECANVGYKVVCAPKNNSFSSVRPDRNFISDDETPLLFKNHCVTVICGV